MTNSISPEAAERNRVMLVLAAKAVGLEVVGYTYGEDFRDPAVLVKNEMGGVSRWNSARNDGDAFRLLVDLGVDTFPPRDDTEAARCDDQLARGQFSKRVLTRLAVTRAAEHRARKAGLTA